jgi:hypothetical protein
VIGKTIGLKGARVVFSSERPAHIDLEIFRGKDEGVLRSAGIRENLMVVRP